MKYFIQGSLYVAANEKGCVYSSGFSITSAVLDIENWQEDGECKEITKEEFLSHYEKSKNEIENFINQNPE
jgi:hypothetical protein